MQTAAEPAAGEDWILWDVVEEHLAEGAFTYDAWRRSLESPFTTLDSVDDRFEGRLKAHVDGLLVGGPAVAERLLKPELLEPEEPSVARSAVAALALLQAGEAPFVREKLASPLPEVATGVEQALSIIAPPGLAGWLDATLASRAEPHVRAAMLRVAAARRAPLSNILAALQSDDEAEASAAVAAARHADVALHANASLALLSSPSRRVREAALETALYWGASFALERGVELAADAKEPHPRAMLLVALLGARRDQEVLLGHLERPVHQRFAARALGFSGNLAHLAPLLTLAAAKDEATAKLAGEAVHNLTGLVTPSVAEADAAEVMGEPDDDQKLAADLRPGAELDLPTPDAAALQSLVHQASARFDWNRRYLQGKPWTLSTVLDLLAKGKMRQRHPVALWLRMLTYGAADVETRALTNQQRSRLNELKSLDEAALVRHPGT